MFPEAIRYAISGVVSNIANFLAYSFLYIIGFPIFSSSMIGYLIGLLISYTFGRLWVFGERFESTKRRFVLFLIVYLIGGFGMSIIISVSNNNFSLDYRICWILGALFAILNNFFGQKYIVFKQE